MRSNPLAGLVVPAGLAAFAAGSLVPLALGTLPAHPLAFVAAALGLFVPAAFALRRPQALARGCGTALVALAVAGGGFGCACWRAQARLADALPRALEGVEIVLRGVVDELPQESERSTRFAFAVEAVESPAGSRVPARVSLAWYAPEPDARDVAPQPPRVHAGERWRLRVRLKRPHGFVNPAGFDLEAWLLAHGLRATGVVAGPDGQQRLDAFAGRPGDYVERARERLRARILAALPAAPYAGVLVALAIGDQRAIPEAQWRVFNRTGVSHLVSISGLHVTAFAALAGALVFAGVRRITSITAHVPARKVAVAAGAALASGYVLLAGAEVPAVRTLAMLLVAAIGLWLGRPGTAACVWLWSLAVVLALDPWAGLAPGFWLSFGAVGLLLFAGSGRLVPVRSQGLRQRAMRIGAEALHAQWVVTVGLVPGTLALFQQVSLVSAVANAIAIPTVTAVIVPLALTGLAVPWDGLWQAAHVVLAALMVALEQMAALPAATWAAHAPATPLLLLALAGVVLLLAPRGVPGRWLGLAWLAPMLLVMPARAPPGAARLFVLDVGQGTAVLIETASHALVYDTGPRYSETSDAGSRVVVPVLRARGVRTLDAVVVSHQDTDHSGGARSLLAVVPATTLWSSLPATHPLLQEAPPATQVVRCLVGMAWTWDGVRFEMLHPPAALYADVRARTNDRSCVLRVAAGGAAALLTGDIEARSEALLLQSAGVDALRADVLLAPHHGSRTSSTAAFIAAVAPVQVVITAGYRNRFGHPRADVVARYRAAGVSVIRTDEAGAVMVELGARRESKAVAVGGWRAAHQRYWHDVPARQPM